MGFLSGAYGKLMAGKLVRQLQNQQTSIQLRLNRVSREIGNMQQMFSAKERNMRAQMQSQMNMVNMGMLNGSTLIGQVGVKGTDAQTLQQQQYQAYMMNQQAMQQQFAMAQNVWQEQFEMEREAQMQPLQDLQDSLQTELDNLKTRLQLAENQYKAHQDEEKAGAKSFTPEYTGG